MSRWTCVHHANFFKKFKPNKNNAEKYALLFSPNKMFFEKFFKKLFFSKIFFTKITPCMYTILSSKKIPGNIPGIYPIPKFVILSLKYSIINFFKNFLHQITPCTYTILSSKKIRGVTSGFYEIPKSVILPIFKRLYTLMTCP